MIKHLALVFASVLATGCTTGPGKSQDQSQDANVNSVICYTDTKCTRNPTEARDPAQCRQMGMASYQQKGTSKCHAV